VEDAQALESACVDRDREAWTEACMTWGRRWIIG
jgi:hypothetical protein